MNDTIQTQLIVEAISKGFDKVAADMGKVGAGAQTASKGMGTLTTAGVALGSMLGGLAAGALAAVGRAFMAAGEAAIGFAADSVELASNLAETASLINNSLGPAADDFRAQLEEISDATGRSANALAQGAQTIIAMSRSMGMAQDQAADFAASMAQIALDLGSFFNQDPAQVFLDLQSALAGSMETMQKYGIDVRESALQQIALNEGLMASGETMSRVVRAQALQIAVIQQAGDAMGDAERTADSFANRSRALKDVIYDVQASLGEALLPSINDFLGVVLDLAENALPKFMKALTPGITDAAGALTEAFKGMSEAITDDDIDELATGFGNLASALAAVVIMGLRFSTWVKDVANDPGVQALLRFMVVNASPFFGPLVTASVAGGIEQGEVGSGGRGSDSGRRGGRTRPPGDIGDATGAAEFVADRTVVLLEQAMRRANIAQAAIDMANEAAHAAALAFADTFGQSLAAGGLDFPDILLQEGIELGLPVSQLAELGLKADYTGEQLREAAIDALTLKEAMRLMGEVDDGRRSIESMTHALELFRAELERNLALTVPEAQPSLSTDTIKRNTLGMEGLSIQDVSAVHETILGAKADAEGLTGVLNSLTSSPLQVMMETNIKTVTETELEPFIAAGRKLENDGFHIPFVLEFSSIGNLPESIIDAVTDELARRGALP